MEVRDPIHGLIEYDELEERVINSRALQRLRGIHQLAMAYLVYPGAVHTRFDHSLGVMHVAGRIAHKLNQFTEDEITNIRLAGLLHDVGHGPFSHVSEVPLATMSEEYLKQSRLAIEKLHEAITVDIIRHDEELGGILQDRRDAIIRLMDSATWPKTTVGRCVISGPLDADKFDYLLRDSHFCGVKYGVYDLERVLDGLRAIPAPGGESYMGVAEESVWAIEQHLMARYHMTLQVYRHRVRRCTDTLLARAIVAAACGGCEEVRDLYTYEGPREEFSTRWLAYDDRRLLDTIEVRCPNTSASCIVRRLRERRLPLRICAMRIADLPDVFYRARITHPEEQQALETTISQRIGQDPALVIVDVLRTEPPRASSSEPAIDPEEILVHMPGAQPRKFHEVSEIFTENPLKGKDRLTIFGPFSSYTKTERDREREGLWGVVREVMHERQAEVSNGR